MTGEFGGGDELGNAKSAFRTNPTGESARLYLLAWADSKSGSMASGSIASGSIASSSIASGSIASTGSPDLLRKFAHDDVYCQAYAETEIARAKGDWPAVAIAVAKFQAAGLQHQLSLAATAQAVRR